MTANVATKIADKMDIYLEKLTLGNLVLALFWSFTGHKVLYFELGRTIRRVPVLRPLWHGRIGKADYHIAEPIGLGYRIHGAAVDAAESIYLGLADLERATLDGACRSFRSEKVRQYIKKYLATESWLLCRDYLVLQERVRAIRLAQDEGLPVRLVVQDTPLNRRLVPFLTETNPAPDVKVTGLSRFPWQMIQDPINVLITDGESLVRLGMFFARRGVTLRREPTRYKIAKELIWGIGVNTGRRNDDFMVDQQQVQPSEVLIYYQRSAAARMGNPAYMAESIQNCASRGYRCVAFDQVPIPLVWGVKQFLPRYVFLPIRLSSMAALKSVVRSEAALLHQVLGSFISQARRWEVMLGSHLPDLNISLDDPYPSHIADTVALNRHGSLNVGFQWSDMTTYRSANLAYLSYDLYLAWGPLPAEFWQGNWAIDRVVTTGYPWGHFYQESLSEKDSLKERLLGRDSMGKLVVSFYDEKPDPNVYQSEAMLYDFYRIAVELLEQREDTMVVVKPKRFDGVPSFQKVLDLIAPYVASGRMVVWDRMQADLWQVLAVSDAAVSMVMGTPHLEAACCGIPGFSYAPTKNETSPIYSQGYGKVVFDAVGDLVDAVNLALDHPGENPWDSLPELISKIDPYRDFLGIDRMREFIMTATDKERQAPVTAVTEVAGVPGVGQ